MRFSYFPPELFEAICDNLDWTDVCSLRLACKRLAESLSQVVCRRVKIDLNPDDEAACIRKLQMLVDGERPQATQGARVLVLILRPSFYVQGQHTNAGKLLPLAIATLKGVHTVDLDMGGGDIENHTFLVDAIVTLPNLRHVTLKATEHKDELASIPLAISRLLPPLLSLHIHHVRPGKGQEEAFGHLLSKAIVNSPHLSSLTVKMHPLHYTGRLDPLTSLHTLLEGVTNGQRPPLKLTALNLSGFSIRLDGETLPHLRHLRSLTLAHFLDPGDLEMEDLEMEDSEAYAVARVAAPFPDLWRELITAGIELTHLNVRHMSGGLAEYVDSYSGLEDIKIYVPNYSHDQASNEDLTVFWDAIAKKHGETLRCLDLTPQIEGEWCFSQKRAPALKKCTKLVVLRIGISTSQFDYQGLERRPNSSIPSCHDVTDLLDVVALNMPKLEQLIICPRTAEPRVELRNGGTINRSGGLVALHKAIGKYSAPVFCEHLPDLEIEFGSNRAFWKSSLRPVGRAKPGLHVTASLMTMVDALQYSAVSLFRPFYRIGTLFNRDGQPAPPRARQLPSAYTLAFWEIAAST